jgi:MFS family permease
MFAGVVLVKAGPAMCFAVNGVSYIAVIISLWKIRLPSFVPRERPLPMKEAFVYIWQNRSVFRTLTLVGASSLFAWSVSTLFPVFAARYHTGARGFSAMVSSNGIGAALGGGLVAVMGERVDRRARVYGGAILFCVALLLLSGAPGYLAALGCLVLSGLAMIAFATSANTKVMEEVPDVLRGRVMAVYSLVFAALMPLGGMEIGALAEHVGAVLAVRINAGLCLLISVALLIWSEWERRAATRSAGLPTGDRPLSSTPTRPAATTHKRHSARRARAG